MILVSTEEGTEMAAAASAKMGMVPPTSPVPPFLLTEQLSCAVHSTHDVHMVASLACCGTALVDTGQNVSHLVSTSGPETTLPF